MTVYEIISVVLSTIAILIPIVQWLWKTWVRKPQLKYYQNHSAILYFDSNGSRIRIDGVYEALHQPITVQNIGLKITRHKDDAKINLTWAQFISPVHQISFGNYSQITEKSHPIRIEQNSIICLFTEFSDPYNSTFKSFNTHATNLVALTPTDCNVILFPQALNCYLSSPQYTNAKKTLEKAFFWEIGKYDIEICVYYTKNKTKKFYFEMMVDENSHQLLTKNIDESLVSILKNAYGIQNNFQCVEVELFDKNKK